MPRSHIYHPKAGWFGFVIAEDQDFLIYGVDCLISKVGYSKWFYCREECDVVDLRRVAFPLVLAPPLLSPLGSVDSDQPPASCALGLNREQLLDAVVISSSDYW